MERDNGADEDVERRQRIDDMKRQVEQLGATHIRESADAPDDVREAFWRHVLAYEQAPLTTNLQRLLAAGVPVPAPDTLDDEQLTAALWRVIEALADLGVVLHCTDHLSDRELYVELFERVLREEVPDLPLDDDMTEHVDCAVGGGEDETRVWLTYYADDETRARWQADFPDDEMPPRKELPHDRDRRLPGGADYQSRE